MFAIQWTYVNGNDAYEQIGGLRYLSAEAAAVNLGKVIECAGRYGVVGLHGVVVQL